MFKKSIAPCNIKVAAFSSIFFSLLLTLISNWLERLKAPTVDNLSSHKQIGKLKFFSIFLEVSLTDCAQSVNDTSKNIEKNFNLPICLWDERLSTVGAFNLSSQLDINVSKREKKIDENAATFILQGAIDFLNN